MPPIGKGSRRASDRSLPSASRTAATAPPSNATRMRFAGWGPSQNTNGRTAISSPSPSRANQPDLALARALAVAGLAQLVHDVRPRHAQPRVQFERPGVDARGQREAPALEVAAHAKVEIQREAGREQGDREQGEAEIPPESPWGKRVQGDAEMPPELPAGERVQGEAEIPPEFPGARHPLDSTLLPRVGDRFPPRSTSEKSALSSRGDSKDEGGRWKSKAEVERGKEKAKSH